MRFPKWIFLFVFVAGAFLGKPIALSFVGLITKAYLFFEFGWQFSYNGVDWKEGHLVFHAIHLKEKGTLDLEAKEASLFFQTHHVQVDHPTVFLTGIPKQKTDLWTISMQEGIFRGGEGLEGVCFSFEKLWPHHLGRFHLSKNGSTAQIEIVEEGNEICFDATLEQFDARHLKYVVDLQGKIEGNVHLVFEKNKSKRGSAHIQVQDAGFKKLVSGIDATLDWEGSLNADWIPKYEDSRMRLLMTKGTLASGEGGVENLKGNCSFTAGVGAKWEFEGQAKLDDKKSPISFLGKAFIHPLRSSWVESKAACGETFFSMKGK
ncbi:MAG: hypothetical protein FJZ64_03745, partial [Chlamydiae bacterium]|nr:hypothetical protein [Chlamydiota bacterium]